ncbi:MAG: GNAT family N-acetyltransferase [Dehalococcoidia bacterium]
MVWIAGDRPYGPSGVVLRAWEREDVRVRWEADQTADAEAQRLRDWHEPPRSLFRREQEWEAEQSEPDASVVSLVIVADERPLGDINLFQIDQRNRHALIGLSLWRREDGDRGYGTDAMRALLRWAFGHLNLHRVELAVDATNERAIHVYEKLGFVREGLRRQHHYDNGEYHDELTMAVLDHEFRALDRCAETVTNGHTGA